MKKAIASILSLLVCVSLLAGCASAEALGSLADRIAGALGVGQTDEIPRFSEMKYERPQPALDDFRLNVEKLEKALDSGSFRTVTHLLDLCYEDYYHFRTMYCIAEIRSCHDMTDRYYAEEFAWCDDAYYDLQELIDDMYYLCAASPLAERLEREYFWEGFAAEYADAEESVYNEESLELMHRESSLMAEYRALVASPTVTLDGREIDVYSALDEAEGDEYERILNAYYDACNEPLSRIYIELVKVRRQQAAVLGYDSYEQMAYSFSFDRDYTPEQAGAYMEEIRRVLVPLYKELGGYWPGADPLSEQALLRTLQGAAENMGGEVKKAFSFMRRYELCDTAFSSNKADKSFQSYLSDYDAPYLFLDPVGDSSDLLSFSHEFGHYLDAYVNGSAYESIDLAECFSQGMEYLLLCNLDGVLDEDGIEALRELKMLDTLETYVQQASFAAFEHAVYAADPEELSAEWLNELSLQLAVDYGYYDGVSENYYAKSWTDIVHFFQSPFYVVSYPISNDVAMQLYELERHARGVGLERYLKALSHDGSGMLETAEAVGLQSPFAPGRIVKVAVDLRESLGLDLWEQAA